MRRYPFRHSVRSARCCTCGVFFLRFIKSLTFVFDIGPYLQGKSFDHTQSICHNVSNTGVKIAKEDTALNSHKVRRVTRYKTIIIFKLFFNHFYDKTCIFSTYL